MDKNTDKKPKHKAQPKFEHEVYEKIKALAKKENRAIANMVETLVFEALDMRANKA